MTDEDPVCRSEKELGMHHLNDGDQRPLKLARRPCHSVDAPIIDTDALVRALDARKIAGCALDTIDPEPLPDPHPLRGRENVIVTPHVAWYSEQALVGLQAGAPAEVRLEP